MNIVVIGMGCPSATPFDFAQDKLRAGEGIPCAALLADVPGYHVPGIQRHGVEVPLAGGALP